MSGFDHPGGFTFLQMGEGRDASAMFEAHHPFTNRAYLEKLLAKHEVDPTKVSQKFVSRNKRKKEKKEEYRTPRNTRTAPPLFLRCSSTLDWGVTQVPVRSFS